MTDQEFRELLEKHARGTCTAQEKDLINQWFNSVGSEEFEFDQNLKSTTEKKLWNSIKPKDKTNSYSNLRKIAATVVLFIAFGSALYNTLTLKVSEGVSSEANEFLEKKFAEVERFQNNQNTTRLVTLGDGTEVRLAPHSEIRYTKKFPVDKREVYLSGEAFFKVKRDTLRPFLVYANEVTTRVLGTSFNVKAVQGEKDVTVVVKTGKVSVSGNKEVTKYIQSKEVILSPNQEAIYHLNDGKVICRLVDVPQVILEKPTLFEMQYDSTSVIKLFDVLQKNYGVPIHFDKEVLSDCILTTSMADEGLYQRIEIICKAIGAEYKRTENAIEIQSTGCK